MLNLYRRHLKKCPHRGKGDDKGRDWTKCSCPIWADGELNGKEYRKSLKTRDWQRAIRQAEREERPMSERSDLMPCTQPGCRERVQSGRCARHTRTVSEAIAGFQNAAADLGEGTKRNYRRVLRSFEDFTTGRGICTVDEIGPELVYDFRTTRTVNTLTWTKELQILRHFFRYAVDCEWTLRNPAKLVAMPKNIKPADREPYSVNDVTKIIAACDTMGRRPYERLRARAMVLTLRYTALRISDVALLEKARIRDGEIFLRTAKNGKTVKLPVHPDLQAALDAVPLPIGADGPDCPYYFWSGHGTKRSMLRDADRTLGVVFKASGVPGACSHRFRHTLATEVLELGGTFEQAADILGDSETIVRKHYAKWSAGRQASISDMMARL